MSGFFAVESKETLLNKVNYRLQFDYDNCFLLTHAPTKWKIIFHHSNTVSHCTGTWLCAAFDGWLGIRPGKGARRFLSQIRPRYSMSMTCRFQQLRRFPSVSSLIHRLPHKQSRLLAEQWNNLRLQRRTAFQRRHKLERDKHIQGNSQSRLYEVQRLLFKWARHYW